MLSKVLILTCVYYCHAPSLLMSSDKCWALKHPERKQGFLVSWPGFVVIVGIVVIRAFIVLEVVKGDETCFTPSFGSLFSPGGKGHGRGQESRWGRKQTEERERLLGLVGGISHLCRLDRNRNGWGVV